MALMSRSDGKQEKCTRLSSLSCLSIYTFQLWQWTGGEGGERSWKSRKFGDFKGGKKRKRSQKENCFEAKRSGGLGKPHGRTWSLMFLRLPMGHRQISLSYLKYTILTPTNGASANHMVVLEVYYIIRLPMGHRQTAWSYLKYTIFYAYQWGMKILRDNTVIRVVFIIVPIRLLMRCQSSRITSIPTRATQTYYAFRIRFLGGHRGEPRSTWGVDRTSQTCRCVDVRPIGGGVVHRGDGDVPFDIPRPGSKSPANVGTRFGEALSGQWWGSLGRKDWCSFTEAWLQHV